MKPSSSVKFLGLHVDRYVDWKEHCTVIICKLNSLKYLFMYISREKKILMYRAQAESRLMYGVYFWGTSSEFCVAGFWNISSLKSHFKDFQISTSQCFLYEFFIYTYSIDQITLEIRGFTRTGCDLRVPHPRKNVLFSSPMVQGQRLFQTLAAHIEDCNSLMIFERMLKDYSLSNVFYFLSYSYLIYNFVFHSWLIECWPILHKILFVWMEINYYYY